MNYIQHSELSNISENQIEGISKQFDVCIPVKQIDWGNIFNNMNWTDQDRIMTGSVNSHATLEYPVKVAYQVAFLKQFITELERRKLEINDCVYDGLGRLMALEDREECYKHYHVREYGITGSSVTISLKENSSFISEGTTGLCSWQASVMLSEYCIYNRNNLPSKILELGSGNGLVGLTVFKTCSIEKIILSDCHPSVLNRLIDNIKINTSEDLIKTEENIDAQGSKLFSLQEKEISPVIEVHRLPWENMTKSVVESLDVDCILAADVVYDSSLFRDLINAMYLFLDYGKCQYIDLACTVRNLETLNIFLSMLNDKNLKYDELSIPTQMHYIWGRDTPMRLIKITKNK